jgi:hypothetical protein
MSTAITPSVLAVRQVRAPQQTTERLELAQTIAELWQMGLIEEVIDGKGVPRFRPKAKQ